MVLGTACVIENGWRCDFWLVRIGSHEPPLHWQKSRHHSDHGFRDGQAARGEGLLERKASDQDKRSVVLCIMPRGEKILTRDPIAPLVTAITTVELGAHNFRDTLRHVLDQLGTAQHASHADSCRQCIFLTERGSKTRNKEHAEYTCLIFRTAIMREEMDLLCFNSERRRLAGTGPSSIQRTFLKYVVVEWGEL